MKPTDGTGSVMDSMSRSRGGKPALPADEARRVHQHLLNLYAECGHNASELGRRLDISRVAAKALVDGVNAPSIPTIKSLAIALRLTEMELRTGQRLIRTGAEEALDVAIKYSPGRWSDRVIGMAWERVARGERHSPREWTTVLDELAGLDKH